MLVRPSLPIGSALRAPDLLIDQGENADGPRWQPRDTDLKSVAAVLDELPDAPALVLLGDPGCGKSTLLRHHELDKAREVLKQPEPDRHRDDAALTFFLSLNHYKPSEPGGPLPDPRAWLATEWARQNPDLPPLEELQQAGRLTLLLDALNEVPAAQAEVVARWKAYLAELQQRCPAARVVFSCRSLDCWSGRCSVGRPCSLITPCCRLATVCNWVRAAGPAAGRCPNAVR